MIRFLDLFTRAMAWLQIAASPIILGLLAGAVVYLFRSDIYGLILAITLAAAGLLIGIVWATRVWKKKGTVEYMGKLLGMPELEKDKD